MLKNFKRAAKSVMGTTYEENHSSHVCYLLLILCIGCNSREKNYNQKDELMEEDNQILRIFLMRMILRVRQ